MSRPLCLITGATEGVGKLTALELARTGFTVVIAARNATQGLQVYVRAVPLATASSSDSSTSAVGGGIRSEPELLPPIRDHMKAIAEKRIRKEGERRSTKYWGA